MRKITLAALPLFLGFLALAHAEEAKRAEPGRPIIHGQALPPSQIALHDLMEPIWRAPTKAEGATRACANPDAIQARVDAAVAEKGTGQFHGMTKIAKQISQACQEKRTDDVSKLIDDLHHQFHKMMHAE